MSGRPRSPRDSSLEEELSEWVDYSASKLVTVVIVVEFGGRCFVTPEFRLVNVAKVYTGVVLWRVKEFFWENNEWERESVNGWEWNDDCQGMPFKAFKERGKVVGGGGFWKVERFVG